MRVSREDAHLVAVEQSIEFLAVLDLGRGTVAARRRDVHAQDDELVFGNVLQVLLQPGHLLVGDVGRIGGRARVEDIVEDDEVAVPDVVGVIRGAECRLEAGVGLRIVGDSLVVVVVSDDLEYGDADLLDSLLVDRVVGHVVPYQVAQRDAVDGSLQLLLYVGDQERKHLFVEHRHLVFAADLHVGQCQKGETLLFGGPFELEAALHDVVVAQSDLLVYLRMPVFHRDLILRGHGDKDERSRPFDAHLVNAPGIGGGHREAVADNDTFDRILAVGNAPYEVHAGFGLDVHLFVKCSENLGAFVLAAGDRTGDQQKGQQIIFDVFDHFFGF